MSEPFLGEIRIFGFNFAPQGWAMCDGQLLPTKQNQSLYSLLGTTYGGDGQNTFALPDLRGRTPIHKSDDINMGQHGGDETVTLNLETMPTHTHTVQASEAVADTTKPAGAIFATTSSSEIYNQPANPNALRPDSLTPVGHDQPHNNMQPFQVLNFCIALQGSYPTRE